MVIHPPLCITSRLLPGVKIGGYVVSIEYAHITSDGRQAYRWFIDGVGEENWHSEDLSRGTCGNLQDGLGDLLCFLGAFAAAIEHRNEYGFSSDNADLFPAELAEWAVENADEISSLECELQEHPGELIVE